MKFTSTLVFSILLINFVSTHAQVPDREISEETTEKNYTFYEDGKPVKKSIKISTTISQDVVFDTLVGNDINASRIRTPKSITKVVNINNNADPDYDETIQFSYTSDASKDFLLEVNDKEIFKALEDSKYLNVTDNKNLSEQNLNDLIIITDTHRNVIKLVLEEYQSNN
ncbi:MAG TPA: hypothetical protein ENH87_20885 [Pricia antarctica]|uniref:Uncharacterized protein n=2 Tax=root TaxID=1 RepID=A0A831QVI7_9FLAO|nr:hypothetical protein [Pricia antarctica]